MKEHKQKHGKCGPVDIKTVICCGDAMGRPIPCSGNSCKAEIGKDTIAWSIDQEWTDPRVWCTKKCITKSLTK